MEIRDEGNAEGWLQFSFDIDNVGRLNFGPKELYWHVWLPQEIEVAWTPFHTQGLSHPARIPDEAYFTDNADLWQHVQGHIDANVFPGARFGILTLTARFRQPGRHEIRFFFSTMYGFFPKR